MLKDPDAKLDYQWDWSEWLTAADTIATATVTGDPELVIDSPAITSTTVTAWISGGAEGRTHQATCRVVTAAGREDDRTLRLMIRHR